MELTKFTHACTRLTNDEGSLVIDPAFVDPSVLDGASHVLITHEHMDHLNPDVLRTVAANRPLTVWANESVSAKVRDIDGVTANVVSDGDTFSAAGFTIEAVGTWHEIIHPDIPRITNTGFVVDGSVFHPGDAFTVPSQKIETLLVPIHAPWSRSADVVDWMREIGAPHAYPVHDGLLSEFGHGFITDFLSENGPGVGDTVYTPLKDGACVHTH